MLVSSSNGELNIVSRSVDGHQGLIYERSSSGHIFPRLEEHDSFYADPAYLYRSDFEENSEILQPRGKEGRSRRPSSPGAHQRSEADPADQSHRQAAGSSSRRRDPAADPSRKRSQKSPYRDRAPVFWRERSQEGGNRRSSPPRRSNVGPSKRDRSQPANQPHGRGRDRSRDRSRRRASSHSDDEPGQWKPDDARVRVDSHDSGAHLKAFPWHTDNVPDHLWEQPGGPQKVASGKQVTGLTRHPSDSHRSTMEVVGKKVAGRASVGPGGSAVLKSTGIEGTNTKIIGHGIQDSAIVRAEAAPTGNPASVSIQQTGEGSGTTRGTNSVHNRLPGF